MWIILFVLGLALYLKEWKKGSKGRTWIMLLALIVLAVGEIQTFLHLWES